MQRKVIKKTLWLIEIQGIPKSLPHIIVNAGATVKRLNCEEGKTLKSLEKRSVIDMLPTSKISLLIRFDCCVFTIWESKIKANRQL